MIIKQGRHPVIEQQLEMGEPYIPNDVSLDRKQQQIMMDSMLNANGNKDFTQGFQFGTKGQPKTNPYEVEIKGEKEDLTWLLK